MSPFTYDYSQRQGNQTDALQDFELCIATESEAAAVEVLKMHPEQYKVLPDIAEPNFYQPHKRNASRFHQISTEDGLELHLVTDARMGLTLGPAICQRGLTSANAHPEVAAYCRNVDDYELSSICFPTLPAFVRGWITLALRANGAPEELVYLMQAERLIDANDVDSAWCETHFTDERQCQEVKELLKGKRRRTIQSPSNWS